jgi:hypothetical protein
MVLMLALAELMELLTLAEELVVEVMIQALQVQVEQVDLV